MLFLLPKKSGLTKTSDIMQMVIRYAKAYMSNKQAAKRKELAANQHALKAESTKFVPLKPKSTRLIRSVSLGESYGAGVGSATKQDELRYTGIKMIGIGQMHKSNSVPVFSSDDADDIAHMRR